MGEDHNEPVTATDVREYAHELVSEIAFMLASVGEGEFARQLIEVLRRHAADQAGA